MTTEYIPFHYIAAGLSFLAAICGSFIGAYFKKRGENSATNHNFNQLIAQVEAQTKVVENIKSDIALSQTTITENIKAEISNNVWMSQERHRIRSVKLEDLFKLTLELENILVKYTNKLNSKETFDDTLEAGLNKIVHIEVIAKIYFYKELNEEAMIVILAFRRMQQKIIQVTGKEKTDETDASEIKKLHREFLAVLSKFKDKALNVAGSKI